LIGAGDDEYSRKQTKLRGCAKKYKDLHLCDITIKPPAEAEGLLIVSTGKKLMQLECCRMGYSIIIPGL